MQQTSHTKIRPPRPPVAVRVVSPTQDPAIRAQNDAATRARMLARREAHKPSNRRTGSSKIKVALNTQATQARHDEHKRWRAYSKATVFEDATAFRGPHYHYLEQAVEVDGREGNVIRITLGYCSNGKTGRALIQATIVVKIGHRRRFTVSYYRQQPGESWLCDSHDFTTKEMVARMLLQ